MASTQSQYCSKSSIEKTYENFKKSPKDRLTKKSYLTTRLDALEEQWKLVTETHRNIIDEATNELLKDKYFTNNVYENIEETYINYKSDIKEALLNVEPTPSFALNPSLAVTSNSTSNVNLPKISIPAFSGQYTEWTTFKDLYTSLIHKNASLDDVQKMHYLKSHLTGEAEQLLRHVPITSVNYQESWSILNNRYNNKKYLVNCLIRHFMNQPSIGTVSCSSVKGLLDTTTNTLNGLKGLGIDVNSWDVIIIYIVCSKLDFESRKQWEAKINISDELPTLKQLKEFLESKFRSLEFLDDKSKIKQSNFSNYKSKVMHVISSGSNVELKPCPFCNKNDHKIVNCKEFGKSNYNSRHNFVQTTGLCFNCLGPNHSSRMCRSTNKCRICKHKHHSMLHPTPTSDPKITGLSQPASLREVNSTESNVKAAFEGPQSMSNVKTHFSKESIPNQILLATALIQAQARNGQLHILRALLDQGSQASFVTEAAIQLLGLKKVPSRSVISGLGGDKSTVASRHIVKINVQSRHDSQFQIQIRAHVLSTITGLLPSQRIGSHNWPQLNEIVLADPDFHTPNKIDILLGADVYGQIMREGLIKGPEGLPTAQKTALGWILSGPTNRVKNDDHSNPAQCHHNIIISMHNHVDDNEMLKKFWQIESDSLNTKLLTHEEQLCEEYYSKTTERDSSGRYIVRLPFREDDPQCKYGNSRDIALKRFNLLENKFKKNPEFKSRYSDVMQEYLDLGHMECVANNDLKRIEGVYLPHHAIIRDEKSTTKVRVVFDASCKGSSGVSLNDTLMVGPTLQPDLRHIIMRWRMHPICLSADIVKMYRQVAVAAQDTEFQRLVWRNDPESEIQDYRLIRVTFGTASAPYLAVKTLQQLAEDERANFPTVAEKVKTDFYVDDLMTGCQTVEEGRTIYTEMKELLSKGGFDLQKWITNNKELADEVMDRKVEQERKVEIKMDKVVKILGLFWDKDSDSFHYSVQLPIQQTPITKRRVISDISRLFDPLGWAAPCVVIAKVMIQKLWLSGIDWDEELPEELLIEWNVYRDNLLKIGELRIPRWVETKADDVSMELHGFCDASNTAYAAVVYLRTIDTNGSVSVNLISSKTKVAPTMQVSIPRLELMGAVLLTRLITEVANILGVDGIKRHGWTDSTIVLAWLSSHPSRWTTFIGNRTSEILSKLDSTQWCHVQSAQNPADIASRGCTPFELALDEMWLHGPSWLRNSIVDYKRPKSMTTDLEKRNIKSHLVIGPKAEEKSLWIKFSNLKKLVRVVAFCRRFLKLKSYKNRNEKFKAYLTSSEIDEALDVCIRQCQNDVFGDDRSRIKPLCPFVDDKGILRVGGRIQNTDLPEDIKHPIILPHKSHFTNLVVDEAHKRTLHGGPSLMLNHLRTKYWIISAKGVVRDFVRKCVVCIRHAAMTKNQLMGQLPRSRVTPARPFLHSGVDFAGPINIRMAKGRGNRSHKGYICLFVCMVTKAIHLEVVNDLTSQGFIAGFKRFVARRGHVSDIWSDNGTNFVGAAKELHRLVVAENSSVALEIQEWISNNCVTWHFIPPHAPNFGGLWEAGVKSTKFHLKRVVGESTLTYEEMSTVLCQIEACLNSRPLSMMSDDHENPSPLTPGHFLVGEPLIVVPERNYEHSNIGTLKRWQLTQRMVQDFWRRWNDEYLVHCLQRYKWSNIIPEPQTGNIVLVKEDNLPPARWLLGKVIKKHPGLDGITRVVTLQCNGSLLKRPTSKLCILPVTD